MAIFIPDDKQKDVINFNGGHALVLAAPGCGKTAILSHRIVKAHQEYGIDYSQMLCLTFTNRASRSMRERVEEVVGKIPFDLFVGNLHRFCIKFLFENEILSLDTGILDDIDQAETIAEMVHPEGQELWAYELKAVLDCSCSIFEKQYFPKSLQIHNIDINYNRFAVQYIEFKKENHLIDFDDILMLTYRAMLEPDFKQKKFSSFKWIQVDEVQDLNPLQLAIIDKLKENNQSTVIYLGDQRQAIYSFLGADRESVFGIQRLCGSNVFQLSNNYRSPTYLLDMLNDYAREELKVDDELLPQTSNTSFIDDALTLAKCYDSYEQFNVLSTLVRQIYDNEEDNEIIGVLVKTNKEADAVSDILNEHHIPNLKLTKKDMFKAVPFKTLYSHFSIVANDTRFSEWSRILYSTKVIDKISEARRCVRKMRAIGLTPLDLILYDDSSYFIEFCNSYRDKELVVFDTETTGLDIFNDDIIQIAAFKIRNGEIIPNSQFDIIIETDKEIPQFLSEGQINPMVLEYASREHLTPEKAFSLFIDYIGNDELVGHNVNYDIHILENNIKRRTNISFTPNIYWDTLKMSRMLDPNLRKHTLKGLLEFFNLEGVNSHNALDDIKATVSLIKHCFSRMSEKLEEQRKFLSHPIMKRIQARMLKYYAPIYMHTAEILYSDTIDHEHTFDFEFNYIYQHMVEKKIIDPIDRFHYMRALFNKVVINEEKDIYFYQQLVNHLYEFRTFNEADLYQNGIVQERVHIMTIHKAKGLEFDNVLIYNVTEGVIPHYKANTPEKRGEDARVLYVALSRAKKRIFITYQNRLSSFIANHNKIYEHFYEMPDGQKERLLKMEEIFVKHG